MPRTILQKNPREIAFYLDGETLKPEEVFTMFYSGLEPLVQSNITLLKQGNYKSLNARKYGDSSEEKTGREKESKEIVHNWMTKFPKENEDLLAEITFDDSSRMTYCLRKRTNFDLSIVKIPSIIYMDGKDESRAIFREARVHDISEVVSKLAHKSFGVDFNEEITSQFNVVGEGVIKPPDREKEVIYVPEPHLLLALENLGKDFPRIVPEVAFIGAKDKKLWYVRDLLPTLVNTEFDLDMLAEFYGALHTLGLMETLDRQVVHYCTSKGRVVTYDPDVLTHTRKISLLSQKDIDDLFEQLKLEEDKYNLHIFPEDIKRIRRLSEETRKALELKGFNQGTLFKHLNKRLNLDNLTNKMNVKE